MRLHRGFTWGDGITAGVNTCWDLTQRNEKCANGLKRDSISWKYTAEDKAFVKVGQTELHCVVLISGYQTHIKASCNHAVWFNEVWPYICTED